MKFRTVAKKTFSAAMVGTMVLSLAACGGNGGSGDSGSDSDSGNDSKSESSDGVTLKFQQWWGAELPEGYLDEIVENYEKETGVKVELLTAPWADTKTAITAGATNNTIADIISVDGAWLSEFVDMGILADVEAAGFDSSLASDVWEVDGTKYVVPVNNFAYPMYVNMDILEDAGVAEILHVH